MNNTGGATHSDNPHRPLHLSYRGIFSGFFFPRVPLAFCFYDPILRVRIAPGVHNVLWVRPACVSRVPFTQSATGRCLLRTIIITTIFNVPAGSSNPSSTNWPVLFVREPRSARSVRFNAAGLALLLLYVYTAFISRTIRLCIYSLICLPGRSHRTLCAQRFYCITTGLKCALLYYVSAIVQSSVRSA